MSGATWIDVGMRVRGELSGPGDLKISGFFEGRIHVSGAVWVAAGAQVKADVVAGRVRIDGVLEGTIRASREASVGPDGRLVGDVYGMLAVDEGGVFQGRIIPSTDEGLVTAPGAPAPAPRKLRLPADGGRLRLPTKRRVTQPSAERAVLRTDDPLPAAGPGTSGTLDAVSGSFATTSSSGTRRAEGGEHRSLSSGRMATVTDAHSVAPPEETARARTPRRLVAMPRQPKPLIHEAPPAAPSTANLPAIQDADLPPPPSPPEPPPVAAPPPPLRPRPTAPTPPRAEAPAPAPDLLGKPSLASSPAMSSLVDEWFEDADFLVKRARDSGEHPAAGHRGSPAPAGPSPRRATRKKKTKKTRRGE